MPSRAKEICTAIETYLNSYPFQVDFVAKRTNLALIRQEGITRATAYISPRTITPGALWETRAEWGMMYEISITTVLPLTSTKISDEDDLIETVEEIQKALLGQPQADAKYITNETSQATFEEADLQDSALFLGTVTVTYVDNN